MALPVPTENELKAIARENHIELMRDELAMGIEALTGRRVIAQTGTGTLEPDVKSELFILDDALSRNRPRLV